MKQQCPKCGNWVEGKKKEDLKRKATGGLVKKGAASAIGAVVGTLIAPGVGTFLGGAAANLLVADDVNKMADKTNDMLFGSANYEFFCPNCGCVWEATADSGNDNQAAKDQLLFQQIWDYFFENSDEILSSTDNVDAFLSEYESKEIISPVPKSELNFLLAFCAYCASDLDKCYIPISRKYINRALRNLNDNEYHLFVEVLNNKDSGRNTASIAPNAIKLLGELNEDQVLLKQEWYWGQLQDAIDEEINKYKEEKVQEKKSYLIKNSLFAVPILLFVIYKYMNYESPEGFWSTLFSWVPIYWTILLTLGGAYLIVIADCNKVFSRKYEEWKEEFIGQYASFKWSDLLK